MLLPRANFTALSSKSFSIISTSVTRFSEIKPALRHDFIHSIASITSSPNQSNRKLSIRSRIFIVHGIAFLFS
ncbi:hypothetical protein L873DRAFT_628775 [Choiromyces venosus 120613-1]|uniref:Uncharacterized protein n=1 Tax=Choiromyces venosus 120613-1 TaxID=1336337 RepID=A0A3N4JT70_9PEZI|nr:hypothetical protein L873DRAFT_628775 [Choiromyces venosus 120613-1]